mmetsp:Transcript_28438/g.28753  ORF Transcript_28438/g.28753 Transcript_28438/m.28753 type:complete len:1169 (+) Transcript_28438:76-3582(+)
MSYQRVADQAVSGLTELEKEVPKGSNAQKYIKYGIGILLGCAAVVSVIAVTENPFASPNSLSPHSKKLDGEAEFDTSGRFVMNDFDTKKPMANFLSGLGGIWGIPMWAFYVNRGQGITAFGIQNKDGGIAKFNTAEKAYQQTPFTAFRTFLKGTRGKEKFHSMPFFPSGYDDEHPNRKMMIGMNEMEIEEIDTQNGIQTNVLYYTVPNEDFPALIRKTTFTNTGKDSVSLEILDGLGRLVPSGLSNAALDGIGRTMEAWMNVYNAGDKTITQPFFHISQGTADTAQVQIIKDGHFSLAFEETDSGSPTLLPFVVDPSVVFGVDTTMTDPSEFYNAASLEDVLTGPQGTTSRTPCSFAGLSKTLAAGASVTIISIYGHAPSLDSYLNVVTPVLLQEKFVEKKRKEATDLAKEVTSRVESETSSPIFDSYIKQSFLDNALRGGLPVVLGDVEKPKIYHIFSRIHGDLERDYNQFQLDTTYFSQGPGNFRDVNQNRRVDVSHTPAVADFNVRMFLSFVQADGYNPLTVASTLFKIPNATVPSLIDSMALETKQSAALEKLLQKSFRPGQLFSDLAKAGVPVKSNRNKFLDTVMSAAVQSPAAQYAQNGYWADHWTYTLDLVDNYLSIYPDKEEYMLYDADPVPFFMSPAVVKSRSARYSLMAKDPSQPQSMVLRVFSAVSAWGEKDFPTERQKALEAIFGDPHFLGEPNVVGGPGGTWQRIKDKDLTVCAVSPIAKLALLGIIKFSTLDPSGMGVEMEGGKPGWNDAMNGLPGILGSGMPETYEMLRILKYVQSSLNKYSRPVVFPKEFSTFLYSLQTALNYIPSSNENGDLHFWNAANDAREMYRASTISYFTGETEKWTASDLASVIDMMITRTQKGIDKAVALNGGLSPSYFYHECSNYGLTSLNKPIANTFNLHTLPLFLEGPVRHMKVLSTIEEKRDVYARTKASEMYDQELKMFLISGSLASMGPDVGRMKAFAPGWLENQSVWLHMSYKFYLELLRAGLFEEFYTEMKPGLVPFMDNDVYGRSPLEAASFIVSSAFPDPKLHGQSFLARLSGSTAEFLSMWVLMFFGSNPFTVDSNGTLQLQLLPALPGWMFTKDDNIASSTFLGTIKVVYHNPNRIDTWTSVPKSVTMTTLTGKTISSDNGILVGENALLVRNQGVTLIDVYF